MVQQQGAMPFLCSKIAGRMVGSPCKPSCSHSCLSYELNSWWENKERSLSKQLRFLATGALRDGGSTGNGRCVEQMLGTGPRSRRGTRWETSPIYKEKVLASGPWDRGCPGGRVPGKEDNVSRPWCTEAMAALGQRGGRWGHVQMSISRRLPNLDTICLNNKKNYWLYKQYSTIFITATYLLASSLRYKLMTKLVFTDCFR